MKSRHRLSDDALTVIRKWRKAQERSPKPWYSIYTWSAARPRAPCERADAQTCGQLLRPLVQNKVFHGVA